MNYMKIYLKMVINQIYFNIPTSHNSDDAWVGMALEPQVKYPVDWPTLIILDKSHS